MALNGLHAISAAQEDFPFFGLVNFAGIGDYNYRPVESNDMVEKYQDTLTWTRGRQTSPRGKSTSQTVVGGVRTSIHVAALVDTNILVYVFDSNSPRKQGVATELLDRGVQDGSLRVPHQAIVERHAAFVSARSVARS